MTWGKKVRSGVISEDSSHSIISYKDCIDQDHWEKQTHQSFQHGEFF